MKRGEDEVMGLCLHVIMRVDVCMCTPAYAYARVCACVCSYSRECCLRNQVLKIETLDFP